MWDFISGWVWGALGVLPFLHTNLLLAFLSDSSSAVSVCVLAFSHLVFEAVPAVFFGIPGAQHGVAALPAHQLVAQGSGRTAVGAVLLGLLWGVAGAVALSPVFFFLLPVLFDFVRPWSGLLLSAVVVVSLALDGLSFKHAAFFLFFGAMGLAVFSLPLAEPLFPLLSGLFGVPALWLASQASMSFGGPAPKAPFWMGLLGAALGGFSVLLPAMSPAFLSAFAFLFLEASPVSFLVLSFALASSKLFFDFFGVLSIGKARSAAAASWQDAGVLFPEGLEALAFGVLGFLLAWVLVFVFWRRFAEILPVFSSRFFAWTLLGLVVAGAFWANGPWGVFVLSWASVSSLAALSQRVPRKYALGVLLVPAIAYAWGWTGF
ncbi:tripartite tricarboxylate transporter permease [Candidatus Micrarchaeota archaeon]|nr:tripartite tricarboxylate transporter permease [Candidatus Micrarchaeota archaeon]